MKIRLKFRKNSAGFIPMLVTVVLIVLALIVIVFLRVYHHGGL